MAPTDPIPRYALKARPWYSSISPGLSSVPASKEPTMTTSAPAAIALAMSPEYLTPPSAITGMLHSLAMRAHSAIAVTCGTPAPATTRVVQIADGPIPTFTASTPTSIRSRVASPVAMLPAMTLMLPNSFLISPAVVITDSECPCAVSTTMTSTPACTKAAARSSDSGPTPMAAPTRRRPRLSLEAWG